MLLSWTSACRVSELRSDAKWVQRVANIEKTLQDGAVLCPTGLEIRRAATLHKAVGLD